METKTLLQSLIAKYRHHKDFADLDMTDINQPCRPNDDALIHLVARLGTPEEVELLVASGAQINAVGGLGYTPLHTATANQRLEIVERLLALGADKTIRNEFDDTPADDARSSGHREVLELLTRGDEPSPNPPLQALIDKYQPCLSVVKLDVNDINRLYSGDDAFIHLVAHRGTPEEIDLLIASGAQVNVAGDLGYTPLHNAALSGHLDVAKKLLELGADPNIQNEYGDKPLAVAEAMNINTKGEYSEIVQFLKQLK